MLDFDGFQKLLPLLLDQPVDSFHIFELQVAINIRYKPYSTYEVYYRLMYVCMYVCMYVRAIYTIHTYHSIHMQIHILSYIHTRHIHIFIQIYRQHIFLLIYIYTYTYIHTCTYIHIHIHIYETDLWQSSWWARRPRWKSQSGFAERSGPPAGRSITWP